MIVALTRARRVFCPKCMQLKLCWLGLMVCSHPEPICEECAKKYTDRGELVKAPFVTEVAPHLDGSMIRQHRCPKCFKPSMRVRRVNDQLHYQCARPSCDHLVVVEREVFRRKA